MKTIVCLALASFLAVSGPVLAADAASAPVPGGSATAAPGDMTDGEVRKVDRNAKKVTIKHGEIKNLDMPSMTMVFGVKDAAMLDKVKQGDKVRFRAASEDGKFTITEIQAAVQ